MTDSAPPYLQIFIFFSVSLTLWEIYLDLRQLKKNKEKELPSEIKDLVPLEKFTKSQAYNVDKRGYSIVSSLITSTCNLLEVVFLWPMLWALAKDVVGENEYARSITWQIMTSFVSYPISIPLGLYSDFVIEERHGFNKKTVKLFFMDLVKNAALSIVFTSLLVPVVIAVVHWGGDNFYWYIWIVCQMLIFVFMFIYPTFIMPLFNKYEKLHDDDLRQKIEELAASLHYPLQKLFQMDGSKRSAHSNAFMFGFWKNKRIVLFDTLLQTQLTMSREAQQELGFEFAVDGEAVKVQKVQSGTSVAGKWNDVHKGRNDELKEGDRIIDINLGESKLSEAKDDDKKQTERVVEELKRVAEAKESCTLNLILDRKPYSTEEILAILCHEIGHWFHGHVLKMLVFSSVHIFSLFRLYAFSKSNPDLLQSFGFDRSENAVMVSLSLFMLMFTPVETVVGMVMTVMTRMNEYQADDFAVKQQRSAELGSGLRKLCIENLGDLNPDPWYAWFHHSHPGLVERLQNMKLKDDIINKKTQ
eukprot:TRINITY_DN15328_c0_g1_i1.p1 TRINITY_DN15328_c0_g1~~TRINITY_DN15328_c0_g1_i1.p1  ORF type:complete len:529 (+),score=134.85 TRINITY_DN15328_c0_g1_i1:92-1678(+)